MGESSFEVLRRLPHGRDEKDPASSYTAMKLGRNETGPLFHPCRISCPRCDQVRGLVSLHNKGVDQYDRSQLLLDLFGQWRAFIHFYEVQHDTLLSEIIDLLCANASLMNRRRLPDVQSSLTDLGDGYFLGTTSPLVPTTRERLKIGAVRRRQMTICVDEPWQAKVS